MAFELPSLPYAHNALAARGMSQETLELHHDKHHQAYVTALNGFVEKDSSLAGKSLEEIIQHANGKADQAPVFNNAGQHWNHILFWQAMSPNGGGVPGKLESKIVEDFGSVDAFKEQFKQAAITQFGSGLAGLAGACVGREAQGDEDAERVEPGGDRRGQAAAWDRCLGALLLRRFSQSAAGLYPELDGQDCEL